MHNKSGTFYQNELCSRLCICGYPNYFKFDKFFSEKEEIERVEIKRNEEFQICYLSDFIPLIFEICKITVLSMRTNYFFEFSICGICVIHLSKFGMDDLVQGDNSLMF